MTIPEWVMIILVTGVLTILGWGFKRQVKSNDDLVAGVNRIDANILKINGKMETAELWMEMHGQSDERQFMENAEEHKELWHAVRERAERP